MACVCIGISTACAPSRPRTQPTPPAREASARPMESSEILRRAMAAYRAGQAALERNDYTQARTQFDHAAWLLLQIPPDDPQYDAAQALLTDVMQTTISVERDLQQQGEVLGEAYDPALIDQFSEVSILVSGEEVSTIQAWAERESRERRYDLPIVINAAVVEMIKAFQTVRREEFERGLRRMPRLIPIYRRMFAEAGLPQDLAYLALIESGFNPRAYSRSHAKGVWQFIAGTARRYGLTINTWLDERSDIVLSGKAAIAYLKDLYAMFGDWWLALAAYNVGERRIEWAIRRAGVRDFWVLRKRGLIPRETRNYVPAFIAALLIVKNPAHFGFTIPNDPPLEWEEIPVVGGLHLKTIAQHAGIDYATLEFLNSSLRYRYIPPGVTYYLKVPRDHVPQVVRVLAQLPRDRTWRAVRVYRIRRGDTLSRIARRFGVSVRALAAWNGISLRTILYPGQIIRIPPGGRTVRYARTASRMRRSGSIGPTTTYRIQPGDTLYAIARRYRTSVSRLLRLNPGISPRRLRIGQRIRVPHPSSVRSDARQRGATAQPRVHRVRRGDTLYSIARRYGVPLEKLLQYNGMRASARIYPGDEIHIPPKEALHEDRGTSRR